MSGHNKWSKVKRKKGVLDSKKSKIFSKHARLIASEVKKAGDKNAASVRAAVERAKADSMPNENIERALQKGAGAEGVVMSEVIFEAFGPGGVALVITALTDNNNRTSQEMRHLLSKNGVPLGAPGSALWAFHKYEGRYIPAAPLELSDADGEKLAELIDELEENDDIQDIFTTADDASGESSA